MQHHRFALADCPKVQNNHNLDYLHSRPVGEDATDEHHHCRFLH